MRLHVLLISAVLLAASPLVQAAPRAPAGSSAHAASATATTPVNINTADAESLASGLKGIGLKKAEAIIAYRKAHGPFSSLEQLQEVKGIGPGIIARNKGLIVLH